MMDKEIKERIETIKKGEVPDGYKRTRMGIIPNEWREVQLRDIAKSVTKKNIDNSITVTFTNSATKGVIKQTDYFEKQISNSENTSGYYVVEQDDYIYNPRISDFAPCGPINKSNFEENGIVSPLYTVFKLRNDLKKNKYIEMYLNSSFWHRYMCSVANYGARHDRMNITNNDFFRMPVPFPPLVEQQKIAEILSWCDIIIEKCEKEVEEYKNLKKTCLSKMFPKKGSNVPEIRFPGFTDAWEQRKVGELSEKTFGGGTPNTSNNEYWNGDIPWFQSSDIPDGKLFDVAPKKFISQDGLIKSAAQLIPENSIAIITRVGVGKLAFVPFSYTTSQDFLSLSKLKTEPFFTVYACYKKLQSELNAVQGTSIKGITKDELLAKQIMVPNYAEQYQIGAFFKNLDHLITLHQRKAEEYKQMKKALTQLLLTGIVRVNKQQEILP